MPVLCWALLQQLGLQRELPKSPAGCPALLGLLSNCWFIPFAHPNRNPVRTGAWGIFLTLASCTEIKKGHMWGWEATGKRLAHLKTLPHLAHSLLCRFPQPLSLYGLPSIISSYYCLSPLIKCTLRVGRDFCPLCLLRQPQWLKPFLAHNGHWTSAFIFKQTETKILWGLKLGRQWHKTQKCKWGWQLLGAFESYEGHPVSRAWHQDVASSISANRVCHLPPACPGCFPGGNGQIALLQLVTPWIGGTCSVWRLAHSGAEPLIRKENVSCLTQDPCSSSLRPSQSHRREMGKQREAQLNSSQSDLWPFSLQNKKNLPEN